MKIVIVSGGTGGHIYPGIAIADEIKRRDPEAEILFLGSREGLEDELVAKAGYRIEFIRARALLRKLSYKAFSAPFVSIIGFFQALLILRSFNPGVVVFTGGYVSLPAVLAARVLMIPAILHEQNVLPGAVNRFCARFSKKIFLSFDESKRYLSGEVVGNPVRRQIIEAPKVNSDKTVVLVMGGSQGARKINETVISALDMLPKDIKLVHIIGNRDFSWASRCLEGKKYENYFPQPYLHEKIADALAEADLVVSRAGATAMAEFFSRGLPMVLVPFPFAADDHQRLNAEAAVKKGVAVMIGDKELTPEKFISLITNTRLKYAKINTDAAKRIVDYIYA